MRRLSNAELVRAVGRLLDTDASALGAKLPNEERTPFDNDYTKQVASSVWVETYDRVLGDLVRELRRERSLASRFLSCPEVTTLTAETPCLRQFIATFGRRALRRPLGDEDINDFASSVGALAEPRDPESVLEAIVRRVLSDPEFIFRVEVGTPIAGKPGAYKLNAFERATRLSFALTGNIPPEWLLDLAESGALDGPGADRTYREAAERLLQAPESEAYLQRFHAQWLGYERLGQGDLDQALRRETEASVTRALAGDHTSLFTATDSYMSARLVQHYGLKDDGIRYDATGFAWVPYGTSGRAGVLGQGAVLSNGAKFGDTSPVLRGKFVRERLLCLEIGAPPADVNADVAPTSSQSNCKRIRYAEHASNSRCAACHQVLDPIGFGLEAFGPRGQRRDVEPGAPECAIDSKGELDGVAFEQPAGLAALLGGEGVGAAALRHCIVLQTLRYVQGRHERADDMTRISRLERRFTQRGNSLRALLLDIVTAPEFSQRTEAP
jgi:hypothetical protein